MAQPVVAALVYSTLVFIHFAFKLFYAHLNYFFVILKVLGFN